MSLKERIDKDLVIAMKARDATRVSTIRLIRSAIKNREIDGGRQMDDEGVIGTLTSMSKQYKDSIEAYEKAGRAELVEREKAELAVVTAYMPEQMDKDEIRSLVAGAVEAAGASGPADMGKVMKELMPKTRGRADGRLVSELVKEALGGSAETDD